MSDRQNRAVRQVHEVLELFTQSELDDNGGTGEEYEKESETVIFAGAVLALLAMLFWSLTVKE